MEAFAEALCGNLASHALTVSWNVSGGHGPFSVTIRIALPDDEVRTVHASGREGTERIHIQYPDGGQIRVRLRAVDSVGADGVGHTSLEAGRCG